MFTHSANCKLLIIMKFTVSKQKQNRIIYIENSGLQLTDGLNRFSEHVRQTGANASFPIYPKCQTNLGVTILSLICITGKWWWLQECGTRQYGSIWVSWSSQWSNGKLYLDFKMSTIEIIVFFLGRKYT